MHTVKDMSLKMQQKTRSEPTIHHHVFKTNLLSLPILYVQPKELILNLSVVSITLKKKIKFATIFSKTIKVTLLYQS